MTAPTPDDLLPPDAPAAPPDEHAAPPLNEDGRSRLLCAAVRVFDRKGYAAASVREIAEAAGVTKPALYYHFGSKEGILSAVIAEGRQEFDALVARVLAGSGPPLDRIVRLCVECYALFIANLSIVRVARAIWFGPPEGAPLGQLKSFDDSFKHAVAALVLEGQATGTIRQDVDGRDVAMIVGGVLNSCHELVLHGSTPPIDSDVLVRLLHLAFTGIITSPRAEGAHSA